MLISNQMEDIALHTLRKKQLIHLAAFVIPAGIFLCAVARLGVYPFGEKTMLTVDMDSEYIDYFTRLGESLRGGGSLLRSQYMGMGLNMTGLIAFYAASPLNLLFAVTPPEHITEAVLALTVLKIGLCGFAFSFYASRVFGRRDSVGLGGAVAYALMGYNVAYSSNIMWLDGVALLPLVLVGVERLVEGASQPPRAFRREGGGRLPATGRAPLTASLALLFWSSYYIGYMAGLFAFLYYTFRFFAGRAAKGSLRLYGRGLLRLLGCAGLAAGCCAVLLLPALLHLRAGQETLFRAPSAGLMSFYPLVRLSAKLLPGVYDSLTDSAMPNLFVTTAAVLAAVLFFLNKAVPARERRVYGLFAGVMALSLSWGAADLAWHAFEEPTWFPARYSFAAGFLVLHLGLRGLARREGLTPRRVAAGMGLCFLLLFELSVSRLPFVRREDAVLAALLVLCHGCILIMRLLSGSAGAKGLVAAAGLLLLCGETLFSSVAQLRGIDAEFGYRDRAGYYAYRERVLPAVERLEREDGGIWRAETAQPRNANGGMALGYRGISHYSTTTDQTLNRQLRALGYNTGTINELRFALNTPLTNGLLGIRYVLASAYPGAGYRPVGEETPGAVNLYENLCAFPLAWFAERTVLDIAGGSENGYRAVAADPFRLQNDWVAAALGEGAPRPFRALPLREERLQNLVRSNAEPGIHAYYRPLRDLTGVLTLTAGNPETRETFAFFPVHERRFVEAEALRGGKSLGRELSYRHNTVLGLGDGTSPQIKLRVDADRVSIGQMLFYGLDVAGARRAAMLARSRGMTFTRFDDTAVDGYITAPRDGVLATTLPYDEGWRVEVGGRRVPLKKLLGCFLAVDLPAGTHTVTMRYLPPGFAVGAGISAMCLLWCAVRCLRDKYPPV